ncbi:glutamate receptor ionotropic, kainate 2 [Lucilia sericata]|uniref:glutamate receptor ionotropic, kainate 2 n=1 Tax=Lucilia sericata TaxID=13632 RepID=UPI0018A86BBB|nr:glutamate receptor ionotropic, kainate 2 [Lucilia sericata]XP_037822508.1 glutamate receptor ionotropic, kainate 2 [Lucilia sericata]XP_037822509.1 glutamate receptor ionotropic, kainate 2 [Lucilia sericata]
MATGIELLVASALCLMCPNETVQYPAGLLHLDANGEITTRVELKPLEEKADVPLDDVPIETLETIALKAQKLTKLREWINGRHLRIATLEDYPLSYTRRYDNGTVVGLGVAFELIDFLKEKFNFTYEVLVPEDNIIGSKTDFAKSLIEMLNTTEADIAAAFLPLLSEQRGFVFYSTTTLDEGEWIMVMQRPNESATGSGLMAPFDYWVWILIFISLLTVGPVIYFLIILRNKLTGDTEQKPYSLGHCAWFVYGALMKQGSILSPIADSTRLLFATWWIFITILTSFYTANLTAFLTLSKFTLPFNTVNDILMKNKHFVSHRGSGVEYAITTTNESLSMLSRMAQQNYAVFTDFTNDTLNLLNYVENNGYVFVRDRPAITHALYLDYRYRKTISLTNEKIHCPFAKAKEPFLKKKRSFAYPIGSNLSDLFDRELLNLVESGIIKHLSAKDLPNAEICPQDLGGTERQLRNGDLMMTYYIMFAGFATAIVVFSTELIFRYINSRHDSHNQWATHGVGRTPNGHQIKPHKWFWRKGSSDSAKRLLNGSQPSNITPPPPYQSIFSSKGRQDDKSMKRWHQAVNFGANGNGGGFGALRPAVADSQYGGMGITSTGLRKFINGREYMVYRTPDGQSQLVPVRVPSAALFQYTYTE